MFDIDNSFITSWIAIPALIFTARLIDVSLATLRHILVFKGAKRLVPVLGFAEVLVWLMAMTQVMQNLDNIASYLAWAGGFSAGTYCGMRLEERLALGHQLVRIISHGPCEDLIERLRGQQFGVTVVPAHGSTGPVQLILVAAGRTKIPALLRTLKAHDPDLFFTLEDVRSVESGISGTPRVTRPAAEETATKGVVSA